MASAMKTRARARKWSLPDEELVERAIRFRDDDESGRTEELRLSLNRYAKYRQWRASDVNALQKDSSDAAVPDLSTLSLRIQDTLYNAVFAARPAMTAKAVAKKDADKQDAVDQILDYQLLVENGEQWLSDAAENFTNDGHFTAFVAWVDETRRVTTTRVVDPIPEGISPGEHFYRVLAQAFGTEARIEPNGNVVSAWDWVVTLPDGETFSVSFYSAPGGLELDVGRMIPRFRGPKIAVKARSDVLTPVAVENLQMPGPSNPKGAPHVVLVDRPTLLEVRELIRSGVYDGVTEQDLDDGYLPRGEVDENAQEQQKSTIGGETENPGQIPPDHERVTRLLVFDVMELNEGRAEDVVYWVLVEPKLLVRKRRLFEAFPSRVPRRPFAESQFLPIPGRRTGIGILELAEGLHDLRKQITDQVVNLGNLHLTPWFFYRPSGILKPEVIRLAAGEGYPTYDPSRDVHFPQINSTGLSYGLNMLATIQQDTERLSLVSDMSLGRVPAGKASALRTVSGMMAIAGQGDARPERILRRFFSGLSQVWLQAHELNRHFLSGGKSFRIAMPMEPGEDPYREVAGGELDATFEFTFSANVLNTSKMAMRESLMNLVGLYLSPLGFQAGVSTEKTVYALYRDVGKAFGVDPHKYIDSPIGQPLVTMEEVIAAIMDGRMPKGFPAEGPQQQAQRLMEFAQSPEIGFIPREHIPLFKQWLDVLNGYIMAQQAAMAMAQAAKGGAQGPQEPQGGGAPPGSEPPAMMQPNELMDETLPTAGGGGAKE